MTIIKCDICKKEIKEQDVEFSVTLMGRNARFFDRATICLSCGKPILALLQKHNLVSDEPGHERPRKAKRAA